MFRKAVSLVAVCAVMASSLAAQSSKFNYPQAKRVDQTDDFHGVKVADPYRWMEETDSPDMKSWIEAENKITQDYISQIPQREAIKNRLTQIWNYERYSAPSKVADGFYVYTKNDGLQNQSVLYRAKSIDDPNPTVFFDPNKIRADGTAALSGSSFSEDGKLWAYGVAEAGSDRTTWHIMNTATGELLPDTLAPNRNGFDGWLKDGSGFYYSSYDRTAEGQELKQATKFQKIYFHKLGTPQSDDKVVYERPDNGDYFSGAEISEDGRWMLVSVTKGTERMNMVYYKDLQKSGDTFHPIVEDLNNSWNFIGNDGSTFYFLTRMQHVDGSSRWTSTAIRSGRTSSPRHRQISSAAG